MKINALCQKILYYGFGFILLNQIAIAKDNSQGIKGTIHDAVTRAALVNANIVIQGTGYGTSSDANGTFRLFGLAPRQYKIKASMIGYKSAEKLVTVLQDSIISLHFALQPTVLVMDSVSVVGKRIRNVITEPSLESPGLELATSTVTRREIKRQGAKTLIDAMRFVPGALVETRGRKVKQFFSVRGQRYPYPEYAFNGAWQREFHEMPYFFSAADIERVEVIRSSAALLTGLSGMAGVINMITREYEKAETSEEIEYGSFGTYRAHLSHGATINKLSYATGIGFQHTNGPPKKHAAEEISNFYGSLHWRSNPKFSFRMNLFHLNGKRELTLATPPADLRFQKTLWSFDPYRATLTNIKAFYRPSQRASTELLLYYTEREPTHEIEDDQTHEITRISERDYEWGVNLIQSLALSKNNVLRFGGLYNHWIAPNGKRFYVGRRCDLETFSAVIVDEHRFDQLGFDAGLRWAKTYIDEYGAFNIQGTPKDLKNVTSVKDEWEPSIFQASIGAVYDFPRIFSLHLNLAYGEIHPRRGTLVQNLKEPKNERRLKLDLGIRALWEELGQFSVVGFLTHQKNAIVLSGQTQEMQGRIMELYLNRDQDQFGIEFESRLARLFNTAEAFFNMTAMVSRAEINEKMQRNQELPKVIGNVGIYAQRGGFDISIFGKYVSIYESIRFVADTKENPAKPQPLGDFFALDMTAGWYLGESYHTRIYFEIKNVTDKAYSTVVGYPDFGRRFNFGIRQSFQ